jgi:ATP-dependent Zn protease
MPRSWWDARARLRTLETTAYHEAAHAVVAYEFGWWVTRGGLRILSWPHASLQFRQSENTVRANVCISMAGLLAEEKLLRVQWRFEEDVIEKLRAVRAGQNDELGYPSDLRAIALALFDDDPPIRFSEARRAIAYLRNETNKLLDEPRVWGGVERVAKVLVRRRYLSPRAVRQLLGDEFFAGVQPGDGPRVSHVVPVVLSNRRDATLEV